MSRPITDIRKSSDGTISCSVASPSTAIHGVLPLLSRRGKGWSDPHDSWFTPQGLRLPSRPLRPGLYIHNGQKISIR